MADIVMAFRSSSRATHWTEADIVMAYIVMADIVMAFRSSSRATHWTAAASSPMRSCFEVHFFHESGSFEVQLIVNFFIGLLFFFNLLMILYFFK